MKHTKRLISVILALLMVLSGAPLTALAEDEEPEVISGHYEDPNSPDCSFDWTYTVATDTLYLDGKIIGSEDIYEDDEYACTHLPLWFEYQGEQLFLDWDYENIVFSKNVEELEGYCLGKEFISKDKIHYVTFEEGSNLKTIHQNAFRNYTIYELDIPDTVTQIYEHAFTYSVFGYFTLPAGLQRLGTGAFHDSGIISFDFNDFPIATLPTGTFENARFELPLEIPETVTKIGNSAFKGATFNDSLILPDSITVIGDSAFRGATFDKYLYIPSSVETIDNYAFTNAVCKKITFGGQVETIGYFAFGNVRTEMLSTYYYNADECEVDNTAFLRSNIQVSVEESVDDSIDYEQHSVSGFLTAKTTTVI